MASMGQITPVVTAASTPDLPEQEGTNIMTTGQPAFSHVADGTIDYSQAPDPCQIQQSREDYEGNRPSQSDKQSDEQSKGKSTDQADGHPTHSGEVPTIVTQNNRPTYPPVTHAIHSQAYHHAPPIVPVSPSDPRHAFNPGYVHNGIAPTRSISTAGVPAEGPSATPATKMTPDKRLPSDSDFSYPPQKRQRPASHSDLAADMSGAPVSYANHQSALLAAPMTMPMPPALPPMQQPVPQNGSTPTIDLTSDDQDEVQVMPSPATQEICYGMLQGITAKATKIAHLSPGVQSTDPWRTPSIKVTIRVKEIPKDVSTNADEYEVHIFDATRTSIGRIDAPFATAISTFVRSNAPFRYVARIPAESQQPNQKPGQVSNRTYPLQVTIFGPRQWGSGLAGHLSKLGLELTVPTIVDRGISYENPQTRLKAVALDANAKQIQQLRQLQQATAAMNQYQPQPGNMLMPGMSHGLRNQFQAGQRSYNWNVNTQSQPDTDAVQRDVMGLFDTLSKRADLPEADSSPIVQTELLKHQKQGLYFMQKREQKVDYDTGSSDWMFKRIASSNGIVRYRNVITGAIQNERPADIYGGLLADEMGLGKTLSILSLCAGSSEEADAWASISPIQRKEPDSNAKGKANVVSDRYAKTPTPIERNIKATLLVCPLSTIQNWEEQIGTHLDASFKTYTYHGAGRTKDVAQLVKYDLILTTYATAATELSHYNKNGYVQPTLEKVAFFRVALDEAHQIRQSSTAIFKAILRLEANRRWAVTGTPIQNRLEDLGSLISFLRLSPFSDPRSFTQNFVTPFKIADPKVVPKLRVLVDSITIRRKKNLVSLPHKHDHVVPLKFAPEESRDYDVFAADAKGRAKVLTQGVEKLKGKAFMTILQAISRLRKMCAYGVAGLSEDDLALLRGRSKEEAIDLDSDDEGEVKSISLSQAYESLQILRDSDSDNCRFCRGRIGATGVAGNNGGGTDDSDDSGGNGANEDDGTTLCYFASCVSLICTSCIAAYKSNSSKKEACIICNTPNGCPVLELKKRENCDGDDTSAPGGSGSKRTLKKVPPPGSIPHTKTQRLVKDLLESEKWTQEHPDEKPEKSIVFSAWTTHLDLIEPSLEKAGISFTRLDGSMTLKKRMQAINQFREDDSIHIILVSIYAGGLGLNLTTGSRVYVMEPQWNPQVEAQAVDRVHRLGQKREVRIIRYIMADSFEEKVQAVQKKKQELADLSMDNKKLSKENATRERLAEIRDLFR